MCDSLKNIAKFLYFAILHYLRGAGGEKTTGASKHFVLSPYLKFAKILNKGLEQSMLILCIYVCCVHFFAHNPTYISRRGNIVSSQFILLGRLAMPKICGRKAQVSRLFYCIAPSSSNSVAAIQGNVRL